MREINFIHSEKQGTLIEIRDNLISGKYLSVEDLKGMLKTYNLSYLKRPKAKAEVEECVA